MDAHPQIVQGATKEIHFFDSYYKRGIKWYHAQFPLPHQLKPDKVTYEATPRYITDPEVPPRIHDYDPNMKLICILRNPIERAFSAWNVLYWRKHGYTTFDEMVDGEIRRLTKPINPRTAYNEKHAGYLLRGLYYEQLSRFYACFPREQLLILENGELRRDAPSTMRKVTEFVGLRDHDWERVTYKQSNKGEYKETMSDSARQKLNEFFRPHNEKLYELLGVDYGWE
jgi:hypothetical protein